MIKIATIIGTRPQFIKAANVSREIAFNGRSTITEVIIHTGQHFDQDMSGIFFHELAIPRPDYNLGIGGGTHGQNTGRMIEAIDSVLIKDPPDWVLVYGDTDSTLAGALAAAKLHIPVAHVEAGLRSYNRSMPEEINRILADQLSTLLFCPTETAVRNLKEEGFPHKLSPRSEQQIIKVGDVMYDAALFYSTRAEEKSLIMQALGLEAKNFVLATIHRAANTDDPSKLSGILDALNQIAQDVPVVLPLHPRTKKNLELFTPIFLTPRASRLQFIDPVGYLDMVMLEKNASVIVTDSGGVQKESYFHGVPCVTVRDETEWGELVEMGVNFLAGTDVQTIIQAVLRAWNDGNVSIAKKQGELYGNGDSANKIVSILKEAYCE